jgi:hypothetical protein
MRYRASRIPLRPLYAVTLVAVVAGCGDGTTDPEDAGPRVTTVAVQAEVSTLNALGRTVRVMSEVLDQRGRRASHVRVPRVPSPGERPSVPSGERCGLPSTPPSRRSRASTAARMTLERERQDGRYDYLTYPRGAEPLSVANLYHLHPLTEWADPDRVGFAAPQTPPDSRRPSR